MPCESCAVQFSVFRRKRACVECERYFCSACLRRGGGLMCAACRVFTTRPLTRHSLYHLKVRDLQYFLQRQQISTHGCVEKEDLVNLVLSNMSQVPPRRRPPPRPAQDFTQTFSSSIKGLTNNLNILINSAFDIRPQPTRAPPPTPAPCYNAAHSHATAGGPSQQATQRPPDTRPRPTTARQNTNNNAQHMPASQTRNNDDPPRPYQVTSPTSSVTVRGSEEELQDTADCLEIQDLDDADDWELINPPAEPLPNDSNVLLTETDTLPAPGSSRMRAASELDLRRSDSVETNTDTASLQDEPLYSPAAPKRTRLGDLKTLEELDGLTPKQLKELLTLNRVDYKGCVERTELLERARRLWRETMQMKDVDKLSIEDSCKICMDAPVECVLLECGHMAACTECSKRLHECPICRQYVVRAVRVFRS